MRLKVIAVLGTMIVLAWPVERAHAGAIRYAGKQLHKGSIAAVQKTSDAKETAVGSAEDASRVTRAALKNESGAVRKDVVSAPGAAVRGTKTAAGKIWKAVW